MKNQATDRFYRIGQKKPVSVYYPIVTAEQGKSVEEFLHEWLEVKKQLAQSVIVPGKGLNMEKEFMMKMRLH